MMETLDNRFIEEAILIKRVEESFLELFSQGLLNGTVHTCVGQEFSAIAFAGQLEPKDFIFSNHRCHGHYIAFTKDYEGLIAELMGKEIGTCGGIGSSQHLCQNNFYSNGIQGGIVPVAAGMALANKLKDNDAIGIVFIGDGTLGEGVVYETMNIISKWEIPLLIVLENNRYAQSTPQHLTLAGDILKRANAFGIKTYQSQTQNPAELMAEALNSITRTRLTKRPTFHLVDTYRLMPHSKGDDNRDKSEIENFRKKDPITRLANEQPEFYEKIVTDVDKKIDLFINSIKDHPELTLEKYTENESFNHSSSVDLKWTKIEEINSRMVDLINEFFIACLGNDPRALFIGEDVLSPYGGLVA